ncbi:Glyoxalase/Bleomycin resistance protein/Dioxygenase family protein [Acidisarcina polymorpha]|uniref:Glyoxalase/Bleomycin resistance protein/Dioxygenase family protein n=1 Tax=Acidisarcina polymorpha TaxID=2211140 RepID=A0A2Z5G2T6_9BACT|nr:VOC family protein [Acidisarcina polymorpha]AXC12846.1 Glyoxalase/Bleomycin resistance protein/Dioxygenase family protein [Acidisarcina polymorpha]
MGKLTGLGGAFLKAKDPKALYAWYEQHLGIQRAEHGSFSFPKSEVTGDTVLAFFPEETPYFGPSGQRTMLNFRVDDLDTILSSLLASGVNVDPERQSYDFGKFGWFTDPEGNRVELWEPSAAEPDA